MKRWRRGERPPPLPWTVAETNLLVISDVHLGEDILMDGPAHLAAYIRVLNRELAAFVTHHASHLHEGRPWHLVINGDMFDFVKVSLRPETEDGALYRPAAASTSEVLPNTEAAVVWKLGRILAIHRPLFRALAHFLAAGHRLTLIEGNHDAEFYFEAVRAALRAELERLSPVATAGQVGERLHFSSWFAAVAGSYHVEHGHHHDSFSTFAYPLAPYDHRVADLLATPMSHRPLPHLAEALGDFSTHNIQAWRGRQIWSLMRQLGPRTVVYSGARLLGMSLRLLLGAGRRRRQELAEQAPRHAARLRALSQETPYGYTTLRALDDLRAMPAEYSRLTVLHMFMLDRLAVLLATSLALAATVRMPAAGALRASLLLGGSAGLWFLSRCRAPPLPETLRRAAAAIARTTGARYVIMGHSHAPELVDLRQALGVERFGAGAYYLNSGSWVTREILRGEDGLGMTYVEITRTGAALMRWQRAGAPPQALARAEGDSNGL